MRVYDLFAGPGGWDEGVRPLGVRPVGVEWDAAACETARAAGHERVQADVSTVGIPLDMDGLIASPPCQGFSTAGKGRGRQDSELLLATIPELRHPEAFSPRMEALREHMSDGRSLFVLEPLRWAVTAMPEWIAWEQVPAVLPVWEACAEVLRGLGYSVWTGLLQAEQYGVPQTRKRAFLIANLQLGVAPPTPTHSRYYPHDPERLDEGVEKWVSMAEALGWHHSERVGFPRLYDGRGEALELDGVLYRGRDMRPASLPSQVVTEKARSWVRWTPTAAVPGGGSGSTRIAVEEAAVLQSFPSDYPWQGSKTAKFRQVGDAVPPLLACHVVAAAMGIPATDKEESDDTAAA